MAGSLVNPQDLPPTGGAYPSMIDIWAIQSRLTKITFTNVHLQINQTGGVHYHINTHSLKSQC